MDNDIENIFSRQAEVLPDEVRRFVASGSWEGTLDGIIAHYNLSEDDTDALRTEIALVLAGLVHPNEFRSALGGELQGVDGATLDALVAEVGAGIFAPIRPALERFFAEQEEGEEVESGKHAPLETAMTRSVSPSLMGLKVESETEREVIMPSPLVRSEVLPSPLERMHDITRQQGAFGQAPDNLPTGEVTVNSQQSIVNSEENAPLIPPLAPKMRPADDVEATESGETHPFEEKMKKVFTGGTADMGELAFSPTPPASPTPPRSINDPYREPIEY